MKDVRSRWKRWCIEIYRYKMLIRYLRCREVSCKLQEQEELSRVMHMPSHLKPLGLIFRSHTLSVASQKSCCLLVNKVELASQCSPWDGLNSATSRHAKGWIVTLGVIMGWMIGCNMWRGLLSKFAAQSAEAQKADVSLRVQVSSRTQNLHGQVDKTERMLEFGRERQYFYSRIFIPHAIQRLPLSYY